ncbi:hypothetical protein [Nocardiopsis gilva]|uniref:hypothetical protein n=1 Tax=Nocardiopsis gilva TaxID=280236 RepID=UPI0012FE1F46|nr:hypothetical protein [Nocardiopsis gilva]
MTTARLRAQLDVCARCRAVVVLALDAPLAALTVRLDPVSLDPPRSSTLAWQAG